MDLSTDMRHPVICQNRRDNGDTPVISDNGDSCTLRAGAHRPFPKPILSFTSETGTPEITGEEKDKKEEGGRKKKKKNKTKTPHHSSNENKNRLLFPDNPREE
ncbi:hypothetical protein CEXT_312861 [Caerostris extrusa]|uniref:Uncharacterized protein n=1 Tax=Caerostris extrusa TaxID=172846 RepID=A0AAV4S9E9_CAEEX|nr:hypothetical protein CEXT_312861 [Caerostris extrusa]